jgi:hypothetical protein
MPLFSTCRISTNIFQKSRGHFQVLGARRVNAASSVLRVTILAQPVNGPVIRLFMLLACEVIHIFFRKKKCCNYAANIWPYPLKFNIPVFVHPWRGFYLAAKKLIICWIFLLHHAKHRNITPKTQHITLKLSDVVRLDRCASGMLRCGKWRYRRFWTTYQSHLQWSDSPRIVA